VSGTALRLGRYDIEHHRRNARISLAASTAIDGAGNSTGAAVRRDICRGQSASIARSAIYGRWPTHTIHTFGQTITAYSVTRSGSRRRTEQRYQGLYDGSIARNHSVDVTGVLDSSSGQRVMNASYVSDNGLTSAISPSGWLRRSPAARESTPTPRPCRRRWLV